MGAQRADSPDLRPSNPFEQRISVFVASAKPRLGIGVCERPLPGGTSITTLVRRSRSAKAPVLPLTVKQVGTGVFTCTSGLINGIVQVRKDSVSGDFITNVDPPIFELTDGWIWLGLKWTLNFTRNSLTTATSLLAFVAADASPPAEDESAGNYVILLAKIEDGVMTNNFSPRKNLWCKVEDKGAGDSKAVITVI